MRFSQRLLIVALLTFIAIFCAEKINLTNSDIGRHIKNGEIFIKKNNIISTNYYSYTEPKFPVVNHHWGAGVIYYKIWKLFKFEGIVLLNVFIYVFAFLFFFISAYRRSNFIYAFLFGILSIPFITSRTEARPEAFSYLFLGIVYYLITVYENDKSRFKILFIIPVIQLIWINLHIFFITGIFVLGVYWLNSLFVKKDKISFKCYSIIITLSIISSIINPYGFKGLIEPFFILEEYGYMIAENQSIPFMQNRFPANPKYLYFEIIFALIIISFILIRKKLRDHLPEFLLASFFLILSWKINRVMSFWGFFFIPIAAINIQSYENTLKSAKIKNLKKYLITIFALIVLVSFLFSKKIFNPLSGNKGLGLIPGNLKAASFITRNNVQGLIFNNYDIGGYLIFALFPEYKVFVDNRPEAYSVSFFKNIFIPMQENENIWKKYEDKYHFQIIFFNRLDMTPWGQPFLIKRIRDKSWAPVFVDDYSLILIKRTRLNKRIIDMYELPESMFIVTE